MVSAGSDSGHGRGLGSGGWRRRGHWHQRLHCRHHALVDGKVFLAQLEAESAARPHHLGGKLVEQRPGAVGPAAPHLFHHQVAHQRKQVEGQGRQPEVEGIGAEVTAWQGAGAEVRLEFLDAVLGWFSASAAPPG